MRALRALPRGPWPIEITELSRHFVKGGVRIDVLRGVDLRLEPGEKVAVLGQSGSGKSTFLQLLGTLDRPTAGGIRFGGLDVFSCAPAELDALRNREIGFVFQFHHLLPDQDALHNVLLPALIAGEPTAQATAEARRLLDAVGLGHRLHHRPGELSGGEQQRVAIARALVRGPSLLLADEPTGNLDPATALEVFDLLMGLGEERKATVVTVTHSMELAARFGRRLRLDRGRFVDPDGAPAPAAEAL
ncbi:MAG: lipoprotein release transporter, ATP-binding protein [Pseudomonadota bacterium]|jgi:lipoprotein-releasing system ATP-binding protein